MSRRHFGRRTVAVVLALGLLLPAASWARGFDLPSAAGPGAGLWELLAGLFSGDWTKNRGQIDPNGQPQGNTDPAGAAKNRASIDPNGQPQGSSEPAAPGQVDPDSGTDNRAGIDPNG
jgi:hypothetical protein